MPAQRILGALLSLGVVPCAAHGPVIPTLEDLAPQGGHQVLVYPELAKDDEPGMYAPDLTELILIAGHADGDGGLLNHSLDFLASEAGWVSGMKMTHMEEPEKCYFDHVWTWRKGTHCIAAWSATDDLRDLLLQVTAVDPTHSKPNTTSYCGFDVNAFVASEMEGFRRSPLWGDFVAYFAQEECETVASIGHSLGGAMATLFAGCANVRADGFGGRSDFGLVTFGAYPVSLTPIYSGTPGNPFVGTRYHVSHETGDPSVAEEAPKQPKLYRLDLLTMFHELAFMMGLQKVAKLIAGHLAVVRNLLDPMVEPYWAANDLDKLLLPFLGISKLLGSGVFPYGLPESITPELIQQGRHIYTMFLRKIIARGDAFFDFDPISSFNQIYGYKHALVDLQPITNHLHGSVPLPRVRAADAVPLPRSDAFRALFGLQATGKLPNHYNCCYYRGKNCPYLYAKSAMPFKACATTLSR